MKKNEHSTKMYFQNGKNLILDIKEFIQIIIKGDYYTHLTLKGYNARMIILPQ